MFHPPAWFGDICLIFVSLLVQGVPFLLLGALVGGFITAFVPLAALVRGWPRHAILSALSGTVFAFVLPACDCAVVPVVRRLVQKGIPLSAGIAYLIAAPTLNPICLIATYLAYRFGSPWHMLFLRAGGSLLLAVSIALLASRFSPASLLKGEVLLGAGSDSGQENGMRVDPRSGPWRRRLALALGVTLTDFLSVSTLYVLGAICSALLQIFAPLGPGLTSHGALSVPAAMSLAFVLSLCSSADAFVVNAFAALGIQGQLAFLWLGPIFNLRTLFVYRNIFPLRAILGLGVVSVLLIWAMTMLLGRLGVS
jgi:uncharacterized membrane protein YraQ (UPF0718 family)